MNRIYHRRSIPNPDTLVDALLLLLGVLVGIIAGQVFFQGGDEPRLEALGCDGTPGYVIYADEEDHLPHCMVIREND